MKPDEVRAVLTDAVPPLTAPPDRMAAVGRRVARARARRAAATALGAAAVVGLLVSVPRLVPLGQAGRAGGGWPSPAVEDGVGVARCPAVLDVMAPTTPAATGERDRSIALPLSSVTLCRYRSASFAVGIVDRIAGPASGASSAFGPALTDYLQQRIWRAPSAGSSSGASNPSGCGQPSPGTNVSIDVVFAVDADGTDHEYVLQRVTCANADAPQPARQLDAAIDQVLGAPY